MWHGFGPDVKFFLALYEFDKANAAKIQAAGCPCGGTLHRANYPRKPRGIPTDAEPYFDHRISFCCNRDGCRARTTPLSIRFFPRIVYASVIVLLAAAAYCHQRAMQEPSNTATNVACTFDVPQRTLRRWAVFFTSTLPSLPGFVVERARFMPPLDEPGLPLSLLERFGGSPEDQLFHALQFVAAITMPPTRRARYPILDMTHAELGSCGKTDSKLSGRCPEAAM